MYEKKIVSIQVLILRLIIRCALWSWKYSSLTEYSINATNIVVISIESKPFSVKNQPMWFL